MHVEHRRSERIAEFLPLEVYVVDQRTDRVHAGPFSGRIIDISNHGACLLMTQVMQHDFHVFYSTRDTDNAVFKLTIDHPPDIAPCTLIARPVWMDVFRQQEIRAFKMGVEFVENPEKEQMRELRTALRHNQEQRGNWWRQHCRLTTTKK